MTNNGPTVLTLEQQILERMSRHYGEAVTRDPEFFEGLATYLSRWMTAKEARERLHDGPENETERRRLLNEMLDCERQIGRLEDRAGHRQLAQ